MRRSDMMLVVAAGALFLSAGTGLAQSNETAGAAGAAPSAGEIAVTHPTKTGTLKVPGATLYYETQGTGPLLLIIPGGPQDAGVFAELSRQLADRYTVVAYDPRGNSRSPFDSAPEALQLDMQADDAAALIKALGQGPAYVFGTSGGAQIGLNLAARHADLVAALVAHEPPTIMLLADPSQSLAEDKEIYDTYRSDGVDAAMGKFFGMNGLEDGAPPEDGPPAFDPSPEEAETFGRVSGNFEYWLAHGMRPLSLYVPEIEVLRQGKPRIVVALGEQSKGQPIYDMGLALAGKLGSEAVPFPGDHMGFGPHADAFAGALDGTLQGR